ncbi:tRNA1(Val) (adenine(37)-N6)-methyltransferase [Maribellus sediminis]|uniref:tRNA1(Val) (adenine(37)-N6)-methyltransferase n=1 Tax=Maribellus sediminis TaxID=2696285 RepID=UPI00142FA75D|nr:methyltransferase [Maribellus sediminis]
MGRNNYFQFKQFRIEQKHSAMKVGIDGVLLGAWAKVDTCQNILDVGAGTGLIALMLAQRSSAQITAIEIEKNAAGEAIENVALSPWKDRVKVKHISFQEFAVHNSQKFDLVVSNPPFFSNSFHAANNERTLARHNQALPFSALIELSANILTEQGRLAVILPVEAAQQFILLAETHKLNMVRLTRVAPDMQKDPHRYLMEFSKQDLPCSTNFLAIRNNHQEDYSAEYKLLCKEFYLLF